MAKPYKVLAEKYNLLSEEEVPSSNHFTPEDIAEALKGFVQDNDIKAVEVQSHYGNRVLPISEMWVENGTLHISVLN